MAQHQPRSQRDELSPPMTLASQSDRFIETARALGADEDEAAFRAKLAAIARQKPVSDDASAASGKQLGKLGRLKGG